SITTTPQKTIVPLFEGPNVRKKLNVNMQTQLKNSALILGALAGVSAYASTDYGPAIYRPMSGCSKWYTTGSGHKFVVCHDMEGYYASTISYLNNCSVTVSIHYMVNGLKDASSDYPAGEIDQQVREAY